MTATMLVFFPYPGEHSVSLSTLNSSPTLTEPHCQHCLYFQDFADVAHSLQTSFSAIYHCGFLVVSCTSWQSLSASLVQL